MRASASNFSRGWEQRLLLINLLTDNTGLRKLRFSTYLSYELFENGNVDECVQSLEQLINNLDEIFDNYSQENYSKEKCTKEKYSILNSASISATISMQMANCGNGCGIFFVNALVPKLKFSISYCSYYR